MEKEENQLRSHQNSSSFSEQKTGAITAVSMACLQGSVTD